MGRRLLAAAAVLGAPATWSLVPALADLDDAAAGAGYARALALGLLVAEAGSLRWPHPLIREAVWSGLLPLEQDRLNRRAAELLLGLDSDDGDTAAAERLALAGETDRAAEVLVRLSRRALDQGGLHRAEEWLCRAAGLGRPVEVARLSVELLASTGRSAAALEIGEPALEQARHDEHADLCLQLAAAAVEAGQWARADELATRAGRPDDPRSLMVRADAAHGAGLVTEAAELANRAVSAAAGAAADVRCEAGCVQGRILRLGSPAAARDAFAAAAQLASEHGLARWRIEALIGLGSLELLADERSPSLQEAHRLAGQVGLLGQEGRAEILLADGLLLTDGPAAMAEPATALIRRSVRLGLPAYAFTGNLVLAARAGLRGETAEMEGRLAQLNDLERRTARQPQPGSGRSRHGGSGPARPGDRQGAARRGRPAVGGVRLDGADVPLRPLGRGRGVDGRTGGAGEGGGGRPAVGAAPGQRAARCSTPMPSWPAGRGGPRRPSRLSPPETALLAPVGWWHRFLRLFTLEAAIADGWGTPVPLLRADLARVRAGGGAPLARICRDLLRRAGDADPTGPGGLDGAAPAPSGGRDQPGARRAAPGRTAD